MNARRQQAARVIGPSTIYDIGLNLKLSGNLVPMHIGKAWFGTGMRKEWCHLDLPYHFIQGSKIIPQLGSHLLGRWMKYDRSR